MRGDERCACRGILPAHPRACDCLDRLFTDQQAHALLDRKLQWFGSVPFAGDGGGDPVTQPRNSGLEAAEELPGTHEVLPAGQDFAPQHATIGQRCGEFVPGSTEAVVDCSTQTRVLCLLLNDVVSELL